MGLRLSLPDRLRVLAFDAAARNKAVTLIPQRGPPKRTGCGKPGTLPYWASSSAMRRGRLPIDASGL
jgi:hypothetical protein